MVTINHLKATTFKVDVAMSCILGLFLGNHIQAGSGRAYKWCPFWCQTGSPSTKVTMITRACDYFAKARVAIFFGAKSEAVRVGISLIPRTRWLDTCFNYCNERRAQDHCMCYQGCKCGSLAQGCSRQGSWKVQLQTRQKWHRQLLTDKMML